MEAEEKGGGGGLEGQRRRLGLPVPARREARVVRSFLFLSALGGVGVHRAWAPCGYVFSERAGASRFPGSP